MSYKTDLQRNNADLQSILDMVNALPEAGGGGSAKATKTVTIVNHGGYPLYYFTEDGIWTQVPYSATSTVDALCGMIAKYNTAIVTIMGGQYVYSQIDSANAYVYILLDDNCTLDVKGENHGGNVEI